MDFNKKLEAPSLLYNYSLLYYLASGPSLDDGEDDDGDVKPGPSNGHVKAKSPQQRAGEKMAQYILEKVKGNSFSFRSVRM